MGGATAFTRHWENVQPGPISDQTQDLKMEDY